MLVFIFIIVLSLILYFTFKRFSISSTETFKNLDYINLSNRCSIKTDILDDIMPQQIIITNSRYAFYKKEIKRTDLLNILRAVKDRNEYTLGIQIDSFKEVENIIEPISFEYFKKFILDEISILVHDYDQQYGYHHIWFQEQASKIEKYLNYSDENYNLDYLEMKMIIGRKDKTKVFNISIKGIFDLLNDKAYITSIELLGLTTDDYSKSGFFDYYRNELNEFDKKGVHCSLSNRRECKLDNLSREDVENYKKMTDDLKWYTDNSKCFFKDSNSKVECLSKDIRGATGIWDTKCRYDTDCPFFGSNGNLNYNNKRGKCLPDGYCELPLGMVPIGYRLYRKGDKYKPLCHNCEPTSECIGINCSRCCDAQVEEGKNPDYAFDNDIIQRDTPENIEKLNKLGLKPLDLKLR